MERKTIALLVSGSEKGVQDHIIEGVRSSCEVMNINLLIFNHLSSVHAIKMFNEKQIAIGECMIYDLIPYDSIDGLIIDSRTFPDEDVLKFIIDTARGKGIPTIALNDIQRGCLHMEMDDMTGETELIRHLVEEHGVKLINFIGGMEGNVETEKRLQAYKQVLSENDIPIEEGRIGYGYFGAPAADVVRSFIDSPLPFPQAIVCANDVMALQAICVLMENGYSVPEDVIVVGFDAYEEGQQFCPSITSVKRGMMDCGETAVKQLYRLWNGKTVPLDTSIIPSIVYGQSCGCVPRSDKQLIKMYKYQHETYSVKNELVEAISGIAHYGFEGNNLREFLKRLYISTRGFEFEKMYFCMEDNPVRLELEEGQHICHFGNLTIDGAVGADEFIGRKVTRESLLPDFDITGADLEKPYCYIFNPVYGRGYNLGYVVRKINSPFKYRGYFRNWLSIVSAYMTVYFFDNEKVIKSSENVDKSQDL